MGALSSRNVTLSKLLIYVTCPRDYLCFKYVYILLHVLLTLFVNYFYKIVKSIRKINIKIQKSYTHATHVAKTYFFPDTLRRKNIEPLTK